MSSGGETLSTEAYNKPVRRRPDTKRQVVPDGSSDAERTKYFAQVQPNLRRKRVDMP
jgi:hypothetical protein